MTIFRTRRRGPKTAIVELTDSEGRNVSVGNGLSAGEVLFVDGKAFVGGLLPTMLEPGTYTLRVEPGSVTGDPED